MKKTVRGPRKKAPRTKGKRKISAASARLKELWQTPEFREKMRIRNEKIAADRKANPEKYSRSGIPDGMRRAQAAPLWERARSLADRFIQIMKDNGELPPEDTFINEDGEVCVVPNSDAGKAEAALREAFVLAVGPSDQKIKIQAINTVLNFTKSKPETKSKLTLNKAEDFLDEVAKDLGASS
jgi:hypothetical protein